MKMSNKLFVTTSLILGTCLMTACQLVTKKDDQEPPKEEITEFLSGIFARIRTDEDDGSISYYPTETMEQEGAIYFYKKTNYTNTGDLFYSIETEGDFVDVRISTRQIEGDSEFGIEASLFYTYELLNKVLYHDPIVHDLESNYYSVNSTGVSLRNGHIRHQVSYKQTISLLQEGELVSSTNIFTLNVIKIDYLVAARLLEFDENNSLIDTTSVDLSLGFSTFEAKLETEYIILEEDYEVKEATPLKVYTKRSLINKDLPKTINQQLIVPNGDGFAREIILKVEFKE